MIKAVSHCGHYKGGIHRLLGDPVSLSSLHLANSPTNTNTSPANLDLGVPNDNLIRIPCFCVVLQSYTRSSAMFQEKNMCILMPRIRALLCHEFHEFRGCEFVSVWYIMNRMTLLISLKYPQC
ncbi:unnamed protein product [Cochlearia groenlandica]